MEMACVQSAGCSFLSVISVTDLTATDIPIGNTSTPALLVLSVKFVTICSIEIVLEGDNENQILMIISASPFTCAPD